MHFRKLQKIQDVQRHFESELQGVLPLELTKWLSFITRQIQGHNLRSRDPAGGSQQQSTPAPGANYDDGNHHNERQAA